MNLMWLLRAKRWAENPPSAARVRLVLIVLALCLAIAGIDYFWDLPEWMIPNDTRGRVIR